MLVEGRAENNENRTNWLNTVVNVFSIIIKYVIWFPDKFLLLVNHSESDRKNEIKTVH